MHQTTTHPRTRARRLRRLVPIAATAALVPLLGPVAAQADPSPTEAAADAAARRALIDEVDGAVGGDAEVVVDPETGLISFVGGGAGDTPSARRGSADPEAAATAFVSRHRAGLGAGGKEDALEATDSTESLGTGTSVRFQQTHAGIPVLGGEAMVSVDDAGNARAVLADLSPTPDVATDAVVAEQEAEAEALAAVVKATGADADALHPGEAELVIYDNRVLGGPGDGQPHLTWRFEVTADSPPVRHLVLVDAEVGVVRLSIDQLAHARNRRVCDWNNAVTPNNPCTLAAAERVEGGPAHAIGEVNTSYDVSGNTYDFFFSRFGFDSWNGAGAVMYSNTRYCEAPGACPLFNAFWSGAQIHLGAGFAAADDVVAHEWGHAYTEHTANLFYYYQAGAINEAYSDIWGEFVDQTNSIGTDTAGVKWLMGEDVPSIGAIRDMEHPPTFNNPDRMRSPLYVDDPLDLGGVHQNSGVFNKAAFLMVDGATFNGVTVTGIGLTDAARVLWETESTMLTSASDFADLDVALVAACTNLVGTGTITAGDCTEVSDATQATEMHLTPNPAAFPNQTQEAPVCTSGSRVDSFTDDFENLSSTTWTATDTGAGTEFYHPQSDGPFGGFLGTAYATSGEYNVWGYGAGATGTAAFRMTNPLTIPAGSSTFLRFNHSWDFDAPDYDGGVIEYSTNGGTTWLDAGSMATHNGYTGTIDNGFGNPLGGRSAYIGHSLGMTSSRFNISPLAGQNVQFRFRLGTDSSVDGFGWFIDDVAIYRCVTAPTVPGAPTGVTGMPGNGQVTVSWTPPSNDGGSLITGYEVTGSPTGSCSTSGATSCIVTGLTNGTPYTFTVRATNGVGQGPPSAASGAVIPDESQCDPGDAGPFTDVNPSNVFCEDIEWLAAEGITTGYPDGSFKPGASIQRQALAAYLYRYAGSPNGDDPTCSSAPFSDVPTSNTFCGEIKWLVDEGITTGYPDGTFRPGAAIQRQAMAAYLYRFDGSPNGDDPTCSSAPFSDVPPSNTFCGEIKWLADNDITTGYPDGTFRPTISIQRQAMAAYLHRYDELP
jgi:Zn-dependent metalloprotease